MFHGEECLNPQKGKSLCLKCGCNFYRITDLHKHLTDQHQFELRIERKTFESMAGNNIMLLKSDTYFINENSIQKLRFCEIGKPQVL